MEKPMYNPVLDSCSLLSADLWNSYKTVTTNYNIKPKLHLSNNRLIKLVVVKLSSSSEQVM